MRKYFSILLCGCVMLLCMGCGKEPSPQSATYKLEKDEDGLFTITDVQILHAMDDQVYEIIETTTLDFSKLEEVALKLMVEYYDETVNNMKDNAPDGTEITSSYSDTGCIYELTMHLHLKEANVQDLATAGYIKGIDEDEVLEELTQISFEETCVGLEAAGYVIQENEIGACD